MNTFFNCALLCKLFAMSSNVGDAPVPYKVIFNIIARIIKIYSKFYDNEVPGPWTHIAIIITDSVLCIFTVIRIPLA